MKTFVLVPRFGGFIHDRWSPLVWACNWMPVMLGSMQQDKCASRDREPEREGEEAELDNLTQGHNANDPKASHRVPSCEAPMTFP